MTSPCCATALRFGVLWRDTIGRMSDQASSRPVPSGFSGSPAATQAGRLGVGIISAGKVGAVLGSALRAVNHQIVGVHAVSEASRERAELLLPGVPILKVEEILRRAELVLLTVPDDALEPLVSGLAAAGQWQMGQIVVHTSGRYGIDVLAPAQAAGAIPIALHPAMTFSGWSMDLERLVGCPMAITAPSAFLPIGQALAVELGGDPFLLADDARPAYHASLAHGANHLVTLVGQASRALAAAGVSEPEAVLRPLLTAALERALTEGADAALTGPVSRGDAGTVAAHLQALAGLRDENGEALRDVTVTYEALARATTDRLERTGGLNATQLAALRQVLVDND